MKVKATIIELEAYGDFNTNDCVRAVVSYSYGADHFGIRRATVEVPAYVAKAWTIGKTIRLSLGAK